MPAARAPVPMRWKLVAAAPAAEAVVEAAVDEALAEAEAELAAVEAEEVEAAV